MNRNLLVTAITLLVLVLGWVTWFWQPDTHQRQDAIPLAATPSGGDFTLQSADGTVSLRDFRGKVVLIYFGYTSCPDICPTSLAFVAQALNVLSKEELARTQGIFISVDPERDTPEKLKTYGAFFHANILGLTGTPEVIAATAQQYGASYRKQDTGSAGGYVVDHSSSTYVIDPNGKLTNTLPHGTPPTEVVKVIRAAMQGK